MGLLITIVGIAFTLLCLWVLGFIIAGLLTIFLPKGKRTTSEY